MQRLGGRRRGYQSRGEAGRVIGRRSRLRATAKLVEHFAAAGLTIHDLSFDPVAEVVRLKRRVIVGLAQVNTLAEYEDDETTRTMRSDLQRLNGLLRDTRVDLKDVPPGNDGIDGDAFDDGADDDDRPEAADHTAIRLHRVFNDGRFDRGGRFYGGWWMALPSHRRAAVLLDGEVTVELDYCALHPRLCYALSRLDWPADADPYALPAAPHVARSVTKAAFTRLLNVSAGVTPRAPKGIPKRLWREALAGVQELHSAIAGWFGAGRGMELQRIDSAIASVVLDSLAYRGIPCLPIHDSFIVPASKELALGESMYMAFRGQMEHFGGRKAWPAISGWSSPAVEAKVMRSMDPDWTPALAPSAGLEEVGAREP